MFPNTANSADKMIRAYPSKKRKNKPKNKQTVNGFESFGNVAGRIPAQYLPSSSFSSPVILCHNASLQSDVCFCTSQQKRNCIAHFGFFSLH